MSTNDRDYFGFRHIILQLLMIGCLIPRPIMTIEHFTSYVSDFEYTPSVHPSKNPDCPTGSYGNDERQNGGRNFESWREGPGPKPSIEVRAILMRCSKTKEEKDDVPVKRNIYNVRADRNENILDFHGFDREEMVHHSEVRDCRRKLIVTIKFNNIGRTKTQDQFVVIDHVLDPVTMHKARLLNPFVIKVRQEPILQLYGLKFEGVVNAEATEEVINKKVSNYTGCDTDLGNPTCGQMFLDGKSIPYSQGFCCSCDPEINAQRQAALFNESDLPTSSNLFSKTKDRSIRPFSNPRSENTNFFRHHKLLDTFETRNMNLQEEANDKDKFQPVYKPFIRRTNAKRYHNLHAPQDDNLTGLIQSYDLESDLTRLKNLRHKEKTKGRESLNQKSVFCHKILHENAPYFSRGFPGDESNFKGSEKEKYRTFKGLKDNSPADDIDRDIFSEFQRSLHEMTSNYKTTQHNYDLSLKNPRIVNLTAELMKLEEEYRKFRMSGIMRNEDQKSQTEDKTTVKNELVNSSAGEYPTQRFDANKAENFSSIESPELDGLTNIDHRFQKRITTSSSTENLSLSANRNIQGQTTNFRNDIRLVLRPTQESRTHQSSLTREVSKSDISPTLAQETTVIQALSYTNIPAALKQQMASDEEQIWFRSTDNSKVDREQELVDFDDRLTINNTDKNDSDVADLLADVVIYDDITDMLNNSQLNNNTKSGSQETNKDTSFKNFVAISTESEYERTSAESRNDLQHIDDLGTNFHNSFGHVTNPTNSFSSFSSGNLPKEDAILLSGSLKNQLANWVSHYKRTKSELKDGKSKLRKDIGKESEVEYNGKVGFGEMRTVSSAVGNLIQDRVPFEDQLPFYMDPRPEEIHLGTDDVTNVFRNNNLHDKLILKSKLGNEFQGGKLTPASEYHFGSTAFRKFPDRGRTKRNLQTMSSSKFSQFYPKSEKISTLFENDVSVDVTTEKQVVKRDKNKRRDPIEFKDVRQENDIFYDYDENETGGVTKEMNSDIKRDIVEYVPDDLSALDESEMDGHSKDKNGEQFAINEESFPAILKNSEETLNAKSDNFKLQNHLFVRIPNTQECTLSSEPVKETGNLDELSAFNHDELNKENSAINNFKIEPSDGWKEKMELLKLKKHADVLKEYLNWRHDVLPPESRIFSDGFTTEISLTKTTEERTINFVTADTDNKDDDESTFASATIAYYSSITDSSATVPEVSDVTELMKTGDEDFIRNKTTISASHGTMTNLPGQLTNCSTNRLNAQDIENSTSTGKILPPCDFVISRSQNNKQNPTCNTEFHNKLNPTGATESLSENLSYSDRQSDLKDVDKDLLIISVVEQDRLSNEKMDSKGRTSLSKIYRIQENHGYETENNVKNLDEINKFDKDENHHQIGRRLMSVEDLNENNDSDDDYLAYDHTEDNIYADASNDVVAKDFGSRNSSTKLKHNWNQLVDKIMHGNLSQSWKLHNITNSSLPEIAIGNKSAIQNLPFRNTDNYIKQIAKKIVHKSKNHNLNHKDAIIKNGISQDKSSHRHHQHPGEKDDVLGKKMEHYSKNNTPARKVIRIIRDDRLNNYDDDVEDSEIIPEESDFDYQESSNADENYSNYDEEDYLPITSADQKFIKPHNLENSDVNVIKIIPLNVPKSSFSVSSKGSRLKKLHYKPNDMKTSRMTASQLPKMDDDYIDEPIVKPGKIKPVQLTEQENEIIDDEDLSQDMETVRYHSLENSSEFCPLMNLPHGKNVNLFHGSDRLTNDNQVSKSYPIKVKIIDVLSVNPLSTNETENVNENSHENYDIVPIVHAKIDPQSEEKENMDHNHVRPFNSDNDPGLVLPSPVEDCQGIEIPISDQVSHRKNTVCSEMNDVEHKIQNNDNTYNSDIVTINIDNDEELKEPIKTGSCPQFNRLDSKNISANSDDNNFHHTRPTEDPKPTEKLYSISNHQDLESTSEIVSSQVDERKKNRLKNTLAIVEFVKKLRELVTRVEPLDFSDTDNNENIIKFQRIVVLLNNGTNEILGKTEKPTVTSDRVVKIGGGTTPKSPHFETEKVEENLRSSENMKSDDNLKLQNAEIELNENRTSNNSNRSTLKPFMGRDKSFLFYDKNNKAAEFKGSSKNLVDSEYQSKNLSKESDENHTIEVLMPKILSVGSKEFQEDKKPLFEKLRTSKHTLNAGNSDDVSDVVTYSDVSNALNSSAMNSRNLSHENEVQKLENSRTENSSDESVKNLEKKLDIRLRNLQKGNFTNDKNSNGNLSDSTKHGSGLTTITDFDHRRQENIAKNNFSTKSIMKERQSAIHSRPDRSTYANRNQRDANHQIYHNRYFPSRTGESRSNNRKLERFESGKDISKRTKNKNRRRMKKKKKKNKKGKSHREVKGKAWLPFGRQLMSVSEHQKLILDSNFDQSEFEHSNRKIYTSDSNSFPLGHRDRRRVHWARYSQKKKNKNHRKDKKGSKKKKGKRTKVKRKKRQIRNGETQVRGGQDCMNRRHPPNVNPDKYLESAHCLRFSDLWYSVYELENPVIEHTVYLQLFEKHSFGDGSTQWVDLTQGSMVRMGTFTRHQRDDKPTVVFTYSNAKIEPKNRDKSLNPTKERLLIPLPIPKKKTSEYPENRSGSSEYLVIPTNAISKDGNECDKVGIGFAAFSKQPNRCGRKSGSCLKNQPLAYWRHDMEARDSGRPGCYFLSNFATVPTNPIKYNVSGSGSQEYLSLEYHSAHVSAIDIEVRTDNNAIVRIGSSGRVTEVYVDSTALEHTVVTVVISNTGLASSAYQPRITDCPMGLPVSWTKAKGMMQVVPAQHDLRVALDLYGQLLLNAFHCSVEIVNHRGELVAMRRIRVQKMDRCFCVWHCLCACIGSVSRIGCQPMSPEHYHAAGFQGPVPVVTDETSTLINVVKDVMILSALLLLLLLLLGFFKWFIGIFFPVVSQWGLETLLESSKSSKYFEPEIKCRCSVSDDNRSLVHSDTDKKVVRICKRKLEFVLNLVFFYMYPIAICCRYFKISCNPSSHHGYCSDESKMSLINKADSCPKIIRVATYGDSRNSKLEAEDTRYVMNELKKSQESLQNPKRGKVGLQVCKRDP